MGSKEILNKEKILEQARAFINEGKFDKAIREYEKILLVDPQDLRVKLRVAELYTKRKQISEAIRIYREVADAYSHEGFYLKAVTVYKNVLRLNPSLIEINEQLGELYEKMGLTSDAVRQYDILASALDLKGDVGRVLDIRSKIVKLNPKDGSARIRLAELYQREGRTDEAIDQYEEYSKQLEEAGVHTSKLADLYEKILSYRPERQDMMRRLIAIYEEQGNHKGALKWLEQGKDFVEEDPDLLSLQARIYALQNQNETARTKFMLLADLYKEAGKVEGVLDAYCQVLILFPDEEDHLSKRVEEIKPGALPGLSAQAQKRREELEAEEERREAAEEAGKAKPKEGEPLPPKPKEAGPPEVAVPTPPAPSAPNRKEADAQFNLGMVYLKTGLDKEAKAELEKAEAIYSRCLEAGVTDPLVKERLERIQSILSGEPSVKEAEVPPVAPSDVAQGKPKEKAPKRKRKKPGKKKISYV
jgi:pilus assembly protein FimV